MTSLEDRVRAWSELEAVIREYAEGRRARVPEFCRRRFAGKGALRLHLEALREDVPVRVINALWSIPFAGASAAIGWLDKLGWSAPRRALGRVPARVATSSHRKLEWLVAREVLGVPYRSGLLVTERDELGERLASDTRLKPLRESPGSAFARPFDPAIWTDELAAYSALRTSATDVATAGATILSAWAFVGFGGAAGLNPFEVGDRVARRMANDEAARGFFLGPDFGRAFYRHFPEAPSQGQIWFWAGVVLVSVAALSVLLQAALDPIHQALGVQERRLRERIDAIEARLLAETRARVAAEIVAASAQG